jgi:hypothetical protein
LDRFLAIAKLPCHLLFPLASSLISIDGPRRIAEVHRC